MSETQGQELPDRAEQYRVDTPQNETPAPVETAQANPADAAPTQETTADNSGEQAAPAQTTEVTETQTVRETTAGTSDNS